MVRDNDRVIRICDELKKNGLKALLCGMPENVLMITGDWPKCGFSFAVVTDDGQIALILPEAELSCTDSWADHVYSFKWGKVDDPSPVVMITQALRTLRKDLQLDGCRIGIEDSFDSIAPPFMAGEPRLPFAMIKTLFKDELPESEFVDATAMLHALRGRKTKREIENIRIANRIAICGAQEFEKACVEGASEAEVAARVEAAIQICAANYGEGLIGRAWALVDSGKKTTNSWKPYMISTAKKLENGDQVLMELGTMVNGYWSDLTRMAFVGDICDEKKKIYDVLKTAQRKAVEAIRPGMKAFQIDEIAREYITNAGYGANFVHHTGHGIGFKYHEPIPMLCPNVETVLEEGMIFSIEPGIYTEEFGGFRYEDNVLVTADGYEILA